MSIKRIETEVVKQKAEDISKSDDIDEEQFQQLDKKETTTKKEKQQVAKHFFQKVYGLTNFTGEAYNELSPLISKYSRLKMTKLQDFDNFVETYLHFESENKSDSSIDQIHRSKKVSKVFYGMKILQSLGFNNPFDTKVIPEINYEKLLEFCKSHNDIDKGLYGRCRMKKEFVEMDINNRSDKIALTKHIQGRLEEIFGISLTASTKSKSDKKRQISGLELYEKHKIIFKTCILLKL